MHDAGLLMNLYKLLADGKLDMPKFLQMLTRAVVQENATSRAGAWFYRGDLKDELVCSTLYDAGDGLWVSGAILSEDDFHPYFETIRETRVVVAPDARTYHATSCFREGYLELLNIYSRLDVSIDVDGIQMGVLSCEQTGQVHEWTQQDLQYTQQAAATIGLALRKFGV